MRAFLSSVFVLVCYVMVKAQHSVPQLPEGTQTVDGHEAWSNDTKMVLVYIFSFVILVLVLRTFRNKDSV